MTRDHKAFWGGSLLLAWVSACTENPEHPVSESREPGFKDVTEASRIDFQHTDGHGGKYYLVETVTGGVAVFDYNDDGLLDLYFVNGAALPGTDSQGEEPPTNELYRNEGDFRFTRVTDEAGVGDTGYGLGCAAADFNNNGHPDLYVSNFDQDRLYRNNGDGTFTDITQAAGLEDRLLGAGVAWVDANRDGWLDLYVANYVHCPLEDPPQCSRLGIPVYCDPSTYEDKYRPRPDRLYLNQQDGTFREISRESGIGRHVGRGMGVVAFDADGDSRTDIFVANDVTENFLFRKSPDDPLGYEEIGLFAGVAYDHLGQRQGSMGCDAADYDRDGHLDLAVTTFQNQTHALYRNLGDGTFEDVSRRAGVAAGSLPLVGWGCLFFDYNNNGYPDLFIANGHLQDRIEELEPSIGYKQANQLFRNEKDGTLTDVSDEAGPGLKGVQSSRGAAYGDLNNDGAPDLVVSNSRERPTVLRNNRPGSRWVNLRLAGTESNRSAVGARVEVRTANLTQVDEVSAGNSYQSHSSLRLHFGLANADRIEAIRIEWPSGTVDTFEEIPANRFYHIREGGELIRAPTTK